MKQHNDSTKKSYQTNNANPVALLVLAVSLAIVSLIVLAAASAISFISVTITLLTPGILAALIVIIASRKRTNR